MHFLEEVTNLLMNLREEGGGSMFDAHVWFLLFCLYLVFPPTQSNSFTLFP